MESFISIPPPNRPSNAPTPDVRRRDLSPNPSLIIGSNSEASPQQSHAGQPNFESEEDLRRNEAAVETLQQMDLWSLVLDLMARVQSGAVTAQNVDNEAGIIRARIARARASLKQISGLDISMAERKEEIFRLEEAIEKKKDLLLRFQAVMGATNIAQEQSKDNNNNNNGNVDGNTNVKNDSDNNPTIKQEPQNNPINNQGDLMGSIDPISDFTGNNSTENKNINNNDMMVDLDDIMSDINFMNQGNSSLNMDGNMNSMSNPGSMTNIGQPTNSNMMSNNGDDMLNFDNSLKDISDDNINVNINNQQQQQQQNMDSGDSMMQTDNAELASYLDDFDKFTF